MSDYYPDPPANLEFWTEKADAMERVTNLATDNEYHSALLEHTVRTCHRWEQSDESICIDSSLPSPEGDISLNAFGYSRHLTIRETNLELYTSVRNKSFAVSGSMNVNGTKFDFTTENGTIFLIEDESMPPVDIPIDHLTRMLLVMLRERLNDQTYDRLPTIMTELDATKADEEKLAVAIHSLGNVDGESSQTVWGMFDDAAEDDCIVARLTEYETPTGSHIDHKLETFESTELFNLETGIEIGLHQNPDEMSTYEIACSGIEKYHALPVALPTRTRFALAALRREDIFMREHFTYSDASDTDQALEYAKICQRFLAIYERLTGQN